jgi:MFS family permease
MLQCVGIEVRRTGICKSVFPAAAATRRLPTLLAVLFLVGVHSALPSAAKLGILPQILQDEDLSRANGVMEFATYGSITAGAVLGALLFAVLQFPPGRLWRQRAEVRGDLASR